MSADAMSEADIDLNPLAQNSRVYDSDGNLLAVLHAEENRSPVTKTARANERPTLRTT